MAIDSITGRKHDLATLKTSPKTELDSGKKTASTSTIKEDTVAITNTAQEIKKAFESSKDSVVDTDRVASIKKAIADGSYNINAEKIAEKMIQFEKSFQEDNSS